jgi:putative membrane protein
VRFLFRVLVTALGLWLATGLVDGVAVGGDTDTERWLTLFGAAVVVGAVNAVLKPIVKVLAFPVYVLTLGLITFVVNALLLLLAARVSEALGLQFEVDGFGAAFWAALIVSVVSLLANVVLPERYES